MFLTVNVQLYVIVLFGKKNETALIILSDRYCAETCSCHQFCLYNEDF